MLACQGSEGNAPVPERSPQITALSGRVERCGKNSVSSMSRGQMRSHTHTETHVRDEEAREESVESDETVLIRKKYLTQLFITF